MSEDSNSNSPNPPTPNIDSRQQVEGNCNQTIGQVYDGMVVYVSGGRAIFNPGAEESSDGEAGSSSPSIGPNPYKGLLAFHEEDSKYYFGRAQDIDDLWNKLRDIHETEGATRLLPIQGPSGSGKSSLARAGLIPELRRRPLPGRDRVRVAVLFPGTKPIQVLAKILAQIATNDPTPVAKIREFSEELMRRNSEGEYDGLQRIASVLPEIGTSSLIVLVDQFEEVYTLCEEDRERNAFIANLLYAAKDRSQYVAAIVTFRSDFLGETYKHPTLSRLFTKSEYFVSAMDEEGLREAIASPAKKAGHPLDDATINLLIEQTEGRVGALPLLQFALTRIWENLPGKTPAETVEEIGGVGGALAGEAQRVYERSNDSEKAIARRMFLGLVQLGEGTRDTRRRVDVGNLIAHQDDRSQFHRVMERFANSGVRLITLSGSEGEEMAEVTHEALFEHWQQLNIWLDENRERLRQQRRIEESAKEWQDKEKAEDYLLRGLPLGEAVQFVRDEDNVVSLSSGAAEFVDASQKAQERRDAEQEQMLRQRQRSRYVFFTLTVGSLILFYYLIIHPEILRLIAMYQSPMVSFSKEEIKNEEVKEARIKEYYKKYVESEDFEIDIELSEFKIDKFEVSNKQFSWCVWARKCKGQIVPNPFRNLSKHPVNLSKHPVINVNSYQAADYCKWLGKRLPTALEWQWAASAFLILPDNISKVPEENNANISAPDSEADSDFKITNPINGNDEFKTKEGINFIVGNVREWTSSYDKSGNEIWNHRSDHLENEYLSVLGNTWKDENKSQIRMSANNPHSPHPEVGIRCAQ